MGRNPRFAKLNGQKPFKNGQKPFKNGQKLFKSGKLGIKLGIKLESRSNPALFDIKNFLKNFRKPIDKSYI
jgi:hypothetical protein